METKILFSPCCGKEVWIKNKDSDLGKCSNCRRIVPLEYSSKDISSQESSKTEERMEPFDYMVCTACGNHCKKSEVHNCTIPSSPQEVPEEKTPFDVPSHKLHCASDSNTECTCSLPPQHTWEERFDDEFPAMGVSGDPKDNCIYRHDQYVNDESLLKDFIRSEKEKSYQKGHKDTCLRCGKIKTTIHTCALHESHKAEKNQAHNLAIQQCIEACDKELRFMSCGCLKRIVENLSALIKE